MLFFPHLTMILNIFNKTLLYIKIRLFFAWIQTSKKVAGHVRRIKLFLCGFKRCFKNTLKFLSFHAI